MTKMIIIDLLIALLRTQSFILALVHTEKKINKTLGTAHPNYDGKCQQIYFDLKE